MPPGVNHELRALSLEISDIGGFREATLHFPERFTVVCGANGVGKSTVLSLLARTFSNHGSPIKKRAAARTHGRSVVRLRLDGEVISLEDDVHRLLPNEPNTTQRPLIHANHSVLYFKASRDITYSSLGAISADPDESQNQWSQEAADGARSGDLKRWLANRFMFSAHSNILSSVQEENFDFAKSCFSLLDPAVAFDRIDPASFDTYVRTDGGSIPFEYLSSGYKASLAMLLGIIHATEMRRLELPARLFAGLILIDELDLHLHPSWQQKILNALKDAFPRSQFIVTTHSPHIIQSAGTNEVIALIFGGNGPEVANLTSSEYGFKGWTLEEILEDVMGLDRVYSQELQLALAVFNSALDAEDANRVGQTLAVIERMLHPENHLRKLLRLQASPFLMASDDPH